MNRRWVARVLSLAIVLALLIGWFAVLHSENRTAKSSGVVSRDAGHEDWQVQLVHLAAKSSKGWSVQPWPFAALQGEADPMPRSMRQAAMRTLGGHQRLGLQFDRSQYVSTTAGGGIWVVRGNRVTCIFQAVRAALACATNANFVPQGLTLVVGQGGAPTRPAHFLMLGIAPDGVKAVRLKPIGKASTTVRVADNAYSLRATSPIDVKKLIR